MYAGRIVEQGTVDEVLDAPRHPYTRGLLDSVPSQQRARPRGCAQIPGMTPSLLDLPPGCAVPRALPARAGALRRRRSPPTLPSSAPGARRAAATIRVGKAAEPPHGRARGTTPTPPLIELRGYRSASCKPPDLAARIGNLLGADVREEVVRAVDRVDLAVAPGRGRRPRRRIRLRQVDARPHRRRHAAADRRRACLVAARRSASLPAPDARAQQLKVQMIFQDPYASLNPRMRVQRHRRRGAASRTASSRRGSASNTCGLTLNRGRARPDADAPLSAPVLRRPARSASASRARSR